MEPYPKKSSRIHQVFESHIGLLSKFLTPTEQNTLKLVNRSAYYNLITTSLWNDIKMQIVAEKYEYIEDDLELETNQPQIKEEGEVKLIRNIRIQSLNKRIAGNSLKKSKDNEQVETKQSASRFPSTYKNRTIIPSSSKPVLNNLKFMKTEIGFKRLSINSKNVMSYEYLLQLPDKLELSMLQPHGKQSMQFILQREQLLVEMINRWLEYQKKILQPMSVELTKQSEQTAYWKVRSSMIKEYQARFRNQKYQKVLKNVSKIIILDDTLKKKLQTFNQYDITISQYSKAIDSIKSLYETIQDKLSKLSQQKSFKFWQQIQEVLQTYITTYKLYTQILSKRALNFIQSIDSLLESGLIDLNISMQKLCVNSEEMELLLQILRSIISKLLQILGLSQSKFKQSLFVTKYTKYKQIISNLSKMTKYFSKIKAQLKQKQKQKKTGSDVKQIQSFVEYYEKYETEYVMIDEKSVKMVEKQMTDFKKRIQVLKNMVKKDKQTE